jgi:hypothetical protein
MGLYMYRSRLLSDWARWACVRLAVGLAGVAARFPLRAGIRQRVVPGYAGGCELERALLPVTV